MSKYLKYILPAILAIILLVVSYKSCSDTKKAHVLQGRYDALAEVNKTQKDNSLTQISDLRLIIEEKDEEISATTSRIVEKEGEISTLHAETDKLEADYELLVAQPDNTAKVDNLTQQVNAWKHKFTLAEGIIADKDVVIFSLNEKYEAQVKISLEWKGLYDREVILHGLSQDRLKIADKKLGGLRLNLNINQGLLYGVAGGMGVYILTSDPVASLLVGVGTAIAKWIIF